MDCDIYDEHFQKKYMTLTFNNVTIATNMRLDGMTLLTDWKTVQMANTEVSESDYIKNLDRAHAGKTATDYFNYTFYFILPWVNENHPADVTAFKIP